MIQWIIDWIKKMFDFEKYKIESQDKVICVYRMIDDLNKLAEGELYFQDNIFQFISGKWGKGYAPKGNYKAYSDQLKHRDEESYTQFGFGWYLPIGAQFETNRSAIMLHPDGGVEGTKGCIGLQFSSVDENVKCFNLFKNYFDKSNILNVEIL